MRELFGYKEFPLLKILLMPCDRASSTFCYKDTETGNLVHALSVGVGNADNSIMTDVLNRYLGESVSAQIQTGKPYRLPDDLVYKLAATTLGMRVCEGYMPDPLFASHDILRQKFVLTEGAYVVAEKSDECLTIEDLHCRAMVESLDLPEDTAISYSVESVMNGMVIQCLVVTHNCVLVTNGPHADVITFADSFDHPMRMIGEFP